MSWLDLGVGLAVMPGLTGALANVGDLIDCLEVEPQTFWWETGEPHRPFRLETDLLDECRASFEAVLVHGVSSPVGGTHLPAPEVAELYAQTCAMLDAQLTSEHLAFNHVDTASTSYSTAFFLPPRQTAAGVQTAVASIRALRADLRAPFSVETPVNYLQPRRDEMADGAFMAEVAEKADCGILLDLHNLWVNERNGRQTALDYIAQLPLDRVWEVHLAGGFKRRGYWLDAHSGKLHPELALLAQAVLPMLPELRAVVYEIMPEFVDERATNLRADLEQVRRLVDRARRTRSCRPEAGAPHTGPVSNHVHASTPQLGHAEPGGGELSPRAWEVLLGGLVTSQVDSRDLPADGDLAAISLIANDLAANDLIADPGVGLLQELVGAGRAGRIASSLPLTVSLLTVRLHVEGTEAIFEQYGRQQPPALWGSAEGRQFARWLSAGDHCDRYLRAALALDEAGLDAVQHEAHVTVELPMDPNALIAAVHAGLDPATCDLPTGTYAAIVGD